MRNSERTITSTLLMYSANTSCRQGPVTEYERVVGFLFMRRWKMTVVTMKKPKKTI
jgi:hypothetical protein